MMLARITLGVSHALARSIVRAIFAPMVAIPIPPNHGAVIMAGWDEWEVAHLALDGREVS